MVRYWNKCLLHFVDLEKKLVYSGKKIFLARRKQKMAVRWKLIAHPQVSSGPPLTKCGVVDKITVCHASVCGSISACGIQGLKYFFPVHFEKL